MGQSAAKKILLLFTIANLLERGDKMSFVNLEEKQEDIMEYIINDKPSGYLVSRNGEVFSIKKGLPKKMKPQKQKNGYYLLHLHLNGNSYYRWIHRMVAELYIPNPENKPQVNHKDGDKSHNFAENLEWVTEKENIRHAIKTNLRKVRYAEKSPNSHLTNDKVKKICSLIEDNKYTLKEISKITEESYYTIYLIYTKKEWMTISDNYDFSNFNKFPKNRGKAKLTEESVEEICKLLKERKLTGREIAEMYNVFENTIYRIRKCKTWRDITTKYFE